MAQPIKQFIDVEITRSGAAVTSVGFNSAACFTSDAALTTVSQITTTTDAVVAIFGADSDEALLAQAYFSQDAFNVYQPKELFFIKVPTVDQAGVTAAFETYSSSDIAANALGLTKLLRETTGFIEMFAASVEATNAISCITSADPNVFVPGNTTNIGAVLKAADIDRTAITGYDGAMLYPDWSWMGQQVPKPLGSTNWAYKKLAGLESGAVAIPPSSLSQSQLDAALAINVNIYTKTLGKAFMFFGTTAKGSYIDDIRNADYLTAELNIGLLDLFATTDVITMTNGGIATLENRIRNILDARGVKQGILIEGTVKVDLPKRSEIDAADREARTVPNGTFSAELQGVVNKFILRGTVFI